jgi:hypothetical protein
MLTRHQIADLVITSRNAGIRDCDIPSVVIWADMLTGQIGNVDANKLVTRWVALPYGDKSTTMRRNFVKQGIQMIAFDRGATAWQLGKDATADTRLVSVLLDIVVDG